MVTIDKDENITVLSNTPTFVYNGENNGGSIKVTNITWKKQEDILLQITDALSIKLYSHGLSKNKKKLTSKKQVILFILKDIICYNIMGFR